MESMDEAEGQHGQLTRKEQYLKTSQKTALLGWAAWWNGLMPGDSMYLFVLSQILLLSTMLWYSTYGTIPAAQNAFDLLSYLLTPFKQFLSDQGKDLTRIGSIVVSYILLSLASLGLLFVGSLGELFVPLDLQYVKSPALESVIYNWYLDIILDPQHKC